MIERVKCMKCGEEIITHINLEDEDTKPEDGDISICIYCGKTTIFDKGNLRDLTQEEEISLPDELRAEIERIEIVREMLK